MPEGPGTAGAFALPEFTRALRGFASVPALGQRDHERVFAPLMTARRAAARVETVDGRLAAFDVPRLRAAVEDSLNAICLDRAPKDGPERRALAALLEELAGPLATALDRMEDTASTVKSAQVAARQDAWRAWLVTVQAAFDAADHLWTGIADALPLVRAVRPARKGRLARAALLAALGGAAAATPLYAQHTTLRVTGVRPESLLAHGFDVVGRDAGAALVVADAGERARLATFGWQGTALPPAAGTLQRGAFNAQVIAAPRVYRSYDDPVRGVRRYIDTLAQNNTRVSVDTLGRSFEGRPMLAVKIGPRGDSPARPNVLFMATYHAREWAATEMALRLIAYLANPPAGNARVDSLLQVRDIWIVPVANPDGYQYTFTNDRLWRKTRSPQAGGAVGVDMNRNHRERWGLDETGSSSIASSEVFRGPSPASEIEVRNIEAFHAAHPPVLSVSYHTYAGLLMYPPGAVYGERPADLPVYKALAGTNLRSAVTDHLPGSPRSFYSPSSSWMLYVTNGEYNDWAAKQYGTLSFTPEITSGYAAGAYYGFEFPDDEALLTQLFSDNLPFALDVIESARDPVGYVSPTTLGRTGRVVLESVSPDVRFIVPTAAAAGASVKAPTPLSFHLDSTAGGRVTRRIVAATPGRPATLGITTLGQTSNFTVLEINGAERSETGWTATGFRLDSLFTAAGKYSWFTPGSGDLRSSVIRVPADADTISLVFWTRYNGSGYDETPYGRVMMSTDGGSGFQPVIRLQGFAPNWYAEGVTVGGVKGKQLVFDFVPAGLAWNLDEIAVVAHGAVTPIPGAGTVAFRPSENPVRRSTVQFSWPFDAQAGDIQAFDFSGHRIWKATVADGAPPAWDLAGARVPNGVYVVVARSGGRTAQVKLFVVRNGS